MSKSTGYVVAFISIAVGVLAGFWSRGHVAEAATKPPAIVNAFKFRGITCIQVYSADPSVAGQWQPLHVSRSGINQNFPAITKTKLHN